MHSASGTSKCKAMTWFLSKPPRVNHRLLSKRSPLQRSSTTTGGSECDSGSGGSAARPLRRNTAAPPRRSWATSASSAQQCSKQLGRSLVHCSRFVSVGPIGLDTLTLGAATPRRLARAVMSEAHSCAEVPVWPSKTIRELNEPIAASATSVQSFTPLAFTAVRQAPSKETTTGEPRSSPALCTSSARDARSALPDKSVALRTRKLPKVEFDMIRLSSGTAFKTCKCRAAH
mmetsp:Transcript_88050/g.224174  ORF Transcript_88050/g.224174 Transcript_88050/m.224174 type:complete len:231 (+) Transcript_88050:507-1199(+)